MKTYVETNLNFIHDEQQRQRQQHQLERNSDYRQF